MIELFSTSTCVYCPQLETFLTSINARFIKRVIDQDPEAETDALMLGIRGAPALRSGDKILLSKDIVSKDGKFYQKRIFDFILENTVNVNELNTKNVWIYK